MVEAMTGASLDKVVAKETCYFRVLEDFGLVWTGLSALQHSPSPDIRIYWGVKGMMEF